MSQLASSATRSSRIKRKLCETPVIPLGQAYIASTLTLAFFTLAALYALDVVHVNDITIEVGTPFFWASSTIELATQPTHNQSIQMEATQQRPGSSYTPRPNVELHMIAENRRSVQQTTSDSRLTRLLTARSEPHTGEQIITDATDMQPTTRPAIVHVSANPVLLACNIVICIGAVAGLCLMQAPQGGQNRNRMGKVPDPPSYDPAHERMFPFRLYTQKLMIWAILAVDMDEGQQCASIANALRGDAALLATNLSYIDLTQGGLVNGVHRGPVEYLLHQLASSFAPLGEEARMQAMTELMSFHAQRNETIDSVISRFRIIRWRGAQGNAGIQMTWEGYCWIFLRAIGMNGMQLVTLLQPFQGQFPITEA